jgi:hypothetical protein
LLTLVATLTLSQISSLAQTPPPDGLMTVTLYSPFKYKRTGAPSLPNGRARPDFRRAYFDFTSGEFHAFGRWNLSYGLISIGQDADWFMVYTDDDQRTVIKDLGELGWNEKFKVPIVPPLPALKAGEHRHVTINAANADRSSSKRSAGLPSEIRGAPSARDQDIGLPSRDPDAGPTFPPPLGSIPQIGDGRSKKPKSDPVLAQIVQGHMYVIHILDARSDFYVLVHVDGLVAGDNCTISWRSLAGSMPPFSYSSR